jgi:hypothetical protein
MSSATAPFLIHGLSAGKLVVGGVTNTVKEIARDFPVRGREKGAGWFYDPRQSQPRHLLAKRREPRRIHQLSRSDVLAQEIVEDLEAALEQFREIATDLGRNEPGD